MRPLIFLGAAGLAAGSPAAAPQVVNFDIINAAPDPSITGPPLFIGTQTGVYNATAAVASATAAVIGVATAAANAAERRDLEERTFCFLGWGPACSKNYGNPVISAPARPTSTPCTTTTTTTSRPVTTSGPVVTTAPPTTSNGVPSTCTPVSWTNTFVFTSDQACPTPYEIGTFCGFVGTPSVPPYINPEDPCAPQPDGFGPKTTPDTADAFEKNEVYHRMAQSAGSPKGYTQTFKDLNAAVNANSYMGLYTLQSYDVQTCADKCDSTDLCTAFNLYIERDPEWNPERCSCTGEDVSSIANYKCTLWGSGVQPGAAVNFGQTRDGFDVVITGSNGYEKTNTTTPATPSGWTKPQQCLGAHDHPKTCIGEKMFKGVFDVNVCATYAAAQNSANVNSGFFSKFMSAFGYNPSKCIFFNAFMLTEDGVAKGTYCKLFAQQYDASFGTQVPGWNNGHFYGVESSWSYCSA
ncbi:hypothetical protein JX265_013944 [Neoarthrinium moseri]|uniref:Uncharacterized protein n=1 Tax=Neoarthrinium moseri TaxID=1658444 RepID=A0A9P9W7J3_9PEZI|nr:hypothetical protein JX265_013944 [Neoarthrinium moseri]